MADRQQVQDLAGLRQLLSPPGTRETQTIDGVVLVTGADGRRYEVPMSFLAPIVAAYALTQRTLDELRRYAREVP